MPNRKPKEESQGQALPNEKDARFLAQWFQGLPLDHEAVVVGVRQGEVTVSPADVVWGVA